MYRLQGFPCGPDYPGQVVNIDAQNVPEDGRAENLQIEKRNRRPFGFGQLMKSKRPPVKICFWGAGRNGRQAQGSSEKFCKIHFPRLVTDFLERFRKDLSDGIFGLDALSCSDQEESIQSLNVIKRGGSVQFSTCYLGIPYLSRGNRMGVFRRVGARGAVKMRSRASGVAASQGSIGTFCWFGPCARAFSSCGPLPFCFTHFRRRAFYRRATPDARERIPYRAAHADQPIRLP